MKTILSKLTGVAVFVMALVSMQNVTAQAPQKMSYQAVVRNSNNELVTSKPVTMRISILQGSATGAPVYVETQTPTTNANGLASLEIGGGTVVTGTVAGINWAAGSYFIKTETDPTGGTSYTITGASQLLSVPYALFSASGNPGPVGPAGVQGSQGIAGSAGVNGAAGAQGIPGSIGPAGPQGIQGIAGPPGSSNGWGITGNAGSNPATNFIGTSDDKDIIIKRNNVRAGLLSVANTSYGVGALNPLSTGGGNVALGINALPNNTTGEFNIATGGASLGFNTTGFNNTANGVRALQNNTTGNNNIAMGFQTMLRNVSGSNATAVGVNAMAYTNNIATSFLNYNVAVGFEALRGSTNASVNTGNYNTAIGYQSLLSNSTGENNTANGYLSLSSNTAGSGNTANGFGTLQNNTSGGGNTATGINSLVSNTTGEFNTATGAVALGFNTSGFNNSASGVRALQNNTTGSNNTANGFQTMIRNTTGSSNTANGVEALRENKEGSNNTAYGWNALYSNTGSNNIGIGSQAEVPSATGSNQVRIGNSSITFAGVQVAWTIGSDRRWKTDIKPTDLGLDFIKKLNPVSYIRISDEAKKTEYGFIAQEIDETLTQFGATNNGIITKDDAGMYNVRYNDLLSPMVKAMQEQQVIIENLKAEVELLTTQHLSLVGKLEMENILLKSDYNNRLKKIEELLNVKAQK